MQTDPQIASRFEPFALPRWKESAELRAFVTSPGRLLPLENPSPLAEKQRIRTLMAYSQGLTGRITTLPAQAAELAIREKTECISLAPLLERAADAGICKLPIHEEAQDA